MSIFKRTQRKYVKKAYRVKNWREYEAGLRNRGSLTVWISLTAGKLVNWDAPRPRRRKPRLTLPGFCGHQPRRDNAPGGVHGRTTTQEVHGGVQEGSGPAVQGGASAASARSLRNWT